MRSSLATNIGRLPVAAQDQLLTLASSGQPMGIDPVAFLHFTKSRRPSNDRRPPKLTAGQMKQRVRELRRQKVR